MNIETKAPTSLGYSSQFLRLIRRAIGREEFSHIEAKYGPFELATYHPSHRVTTKILSSMLEEVADDVEDQNIGYSIGQCVEIGQFGPASYYALSCSTVYEVFRFYARFHELLINTNEAISLSLTDKYLQLEIQAPVLAQKGDYIRYEMLISTLVRVIQFNVSIDCYPEYFELPIATDVDFQRLKSTFNSEVHHSDGQIILRYGRRWLGYRLPNENHTMRQILRTDVEAQLKQLRAQRSFVEQVNIHLEELLDFSNVTQLSVAEAFEIPGHMLERRLQDEQTDFNSVLQRFKQTYALTLVGNQRHRLESVSTDLGFSEFTKFEQQFKLWFGMTPSQFRKTAQLGNISSSLDLFLNQEALPASPVVCQQIMQITAQSDFDVEDLTEVIQTDPVLTGKIIGLSNSALYGGISKTTSLHQSIVKLGIEPVVNIALAILTNEAAGGKQKLLVDRKQYWLSALTTAYWSREFCALSDELKKDKDALFLVGLLHNIGFVLLARLRTDDMVTVIPKLVNQLELKGKVNLEQKHLGLSRYSASAILLAHWGLPVELIAIIHGLNQIIEGKEASSLASQLVYQIIDYQIKTASGELNDDACDIFIEQVSTLLNIDRPTIQATINRLNEYQPKLLELSSMLSG